MKEEIEGRKQRDVAAKHNEGRGKRRPLCGCGCAHVMWEGRVGEKRWEIMNATQRRLLN